MKLLSVSRYAVGILCLFGVVLLWVGSSFVISSIFAEQEFNKPFFLTYFNTGLFSLYLVVVAVQRGYSKRLFRTRSMSSTELDPLKAFPESCNKKSPDQSNTVSLLTDRETAKLSFTFCILWMCANWATNSSLSYTTVGSSTILSSTSSIFTLVFGSLLKVEKASLSKIIGIALSMLGVALVGASDITPSADSSFSTSSMILGDGIALAGAVFYGLYTTFLKLKAGDEERVDMRLFLGFVGLINLIIMIPIFFILHYSQLEIFEFPPNFTLWLTLFFNGLLGTFLSDLLWIYAVVMTSPLVVTMGLSLTIPLAMIGDTLFKNVYSSPIHIAGASLLVIGFLVINSITYYETEEANKPNLFASDEFTS